MKEIVLAKHSGFCFGVKSAIDLAFTQGKLHRSKKIYTCGSLIHNKFVIGNLEKEGVKKIDSPLEAEENSSIIVRSHGEAPDFYRDCEDRGINVIDATCPFVSKIHNIVNNASKEGYFIVIVGDKNHPEVKGIKGWAGENSIVINSVKEAENIDFENFWLVCQTTIENTLLESIRESFDKRGINYKFTNTICSATKDRQMSAMELSKNMEAMIIIGDKNSSNSKKLYEICKKECKNSYFIENKSDLPLQVLEKCNKIGIVAGASTPDYIIKEVIAEMNDNNTEEKNLMEDFVEEIEKSLRLPRTGEKVVGTVHQVMDSELIVNLGCKKDGILTVDEITLEEGKTLKDSFKEGDEIQAKVISTGDADGSIMLSSKKLEASAHWDDLVKAQEEGAIIDVKVKRAVNGGVIAMYKEVSGFIPLSQLSDRFIENADEFIGQDLQVKVSRVDQRRGKAIFSRKILLTEERNKKIEEIWSKLNVGDTVNGKVMRFTDYGAFIDIGGIDGLLHISEISWGKLKHPSEVLEIDQEVSVKILSMNSEKGKVSLGLKQNQPEPWTIINDKYEVGQIVSGEVVQLKEYGAFIELEPGLDGLVHISEVAHKRVSDISEELKLGQEVSAKILDIDSERKRISLSIKRLIENEEADSEVENSEDVVETAEPQEVEAEATEETEE